MIAANELAEVLGGILVFVLLIALLGAVAWAVSHLVNNGGGKRNSKLRRHPHARRPRDGSTSTPERLGN